MDSKHYATLFIKSSPTCFDVSIKACKNALWCHLEPYQPNILYTTPVLLKYRKLPNISPPPPPSISPPFFSLLMISMHKLPRILGSQWISPCISRTGTIFMIHNFWQNSCFSKNTKALFRREETFKSIFSPKQRRLCGDWKVKKKIIMLVQLILLVKYTCIRDLPPPPPE